MKKHIILLMALSFSIAIWAQTVPTKVLRIQDATTALGKNIPVGTLVYNIATQETFIATAGVASTANLTTATASFKPVGITEFSGDATLANDGTLTIEDGAVDGSDISIAGETEGDMAYYNGTEWVRLPKGSANQSLVMNSGATAPEWQSGGSTEDVEVVLDEQVIGDGGTLTLPADLSDYAYLRFEVDDLSGSGNPHSFSETVKADVVANKTVYMYKDASIFSYFVINGAGTVATFTESFSGISATCRVVGIKPQKAVVNPSDAVVIDDDTFASATDANVPSAESVKAYVDANGFSIANEAEGDMAYYNGTEWVRLPKGTANQSLVMNSGATAPEWQSGGPTEDVETVLGTATGGDGTTIPIPVNISDYEYLRLESDNWTISSAGHAIHGTVLVSSIASKRILIYADGTDYLHADVNASSTSLVIHCTGTADWRIVGIKAQKTVVNPADATVIDDDTFASATDANVPSAESVKAYVDANGFSIANEAEGDMAYYNGTEWVRLPKGTANQSLVMNSGATAPEWQSGGPTEDVEVELGSATFTSAGTTQAVLNTGLTWASEKAKYAYFRFEVIGDPSNSVNRIYPSTTVKASDIQINHQLRLSEGSSTNNYYMYPYIRANGDMQLNFNGWPSVFIRVVGIKAQKAVVNPADATVIDDDTFATASSSNVPSAESVKALVDNTVQDMVEQVNPSNEIRYIDIGDVRIQWGHLTVNGNASIGVYAMGGATTASSLTASVLANQGTVNWYNVNTNIVNSNTVTFNVFQNGSATIATIKWMLIGPKP